MQRTSIGWAYLDEDQSVRALLQTMATLLDKEDALFVPTCTQANLIALMAMAERGTQIIAEAQSHIAVAEELGTAYVCGVQIRSIQVDGGQLTAGEVEHVLTEIRDTGVPKASVVCLESPHTRAGGTILDVGAISSIASVARRFGSRVHLDGARLFNAAVALGTEPRQLTRAVDSVAVSLNKGLSAPFGAVLAGPQTVIAAAKINLRRLGGASMHRAGIAAVAALVSLETMEAQLAADNRRARELAERFRAIPGIRLTPPIVETNIVTLDLCDLHFSSEGFVEKLATHGILGLARPAAQVRFVTHRLINDGDVERAAKAVALVVNSMLATTTGRAQKMV